MEKQDGSIFNSEISDFHYLKTLFITADKFVFIKYKSDVSEFRMSGQLAGAGGGSC